MSRPFLSCSAIYVTNKMMESLTRLSNLFFFSFILRVSSVRIEGNRIS